MSQRANEEAPPRKCSRRTCKRVASYTEAAVTAAGQDLDPKWDLFELRQSDKKDLRFWPAGGSAGLGVFLRADTVYTGERLPFTGPHTVCVFTCIHSH